MTKCYQDTMAITRIFWKPSFFITFTSNPNWDEVTSQLEPGQTAESRPDTVAIVFKQKLDVLVHELKVKFIMGKCIGNVYNIEYQKRHLPHAHILIYLQYDDVLRTVKHVDSVIQARLPTNDNELAELIKSQMTHGPCSPGHPTAKCMVDERGKCSKGFPKRWCEETLFVDGSYVEYARPQDGQTWEKNGFTIDNRWVVPYNPYLTK